MAEKIDYVLAQGLLSMKIIPAHLNPFEMFPQHYLRLGGVVPQVAGELFEVSVVGYDFSLFHLTLISHPCWLTFLRTPSQEGIESGVRTPPPILCHNPITILIPFLLPLLRGD